VLRLVGVDHGSLITPIQNKQILDVRHRRRIVFGCGELQVSTSCRQPEHHAVVAGVAREVVDLA
jgi:hypothetical protein